MEEFVEYEDDCLRERRQSKRVRFEFHTGDLTLPHKVLHKRIFRRKSELQGPTLSLGLQSAKVGECAQREKDE